MVPFLQNASNLKKLNLNESILKSQGFNVLLRSLQNSPVEELCCKGCGISSIEIDTQYVPRNLKLLMLSENAINADGCRELAKLLQRRNTTLGGLYLSRNKIDDEGVEILVGALQNNTSLRTLSLWRNGGISKEGYSKLLRLVNDISSIEATLQSNHTLRTLNLDVKDKDLNQRIKTATSINSRNRSNPEAAGRKKVIQTQLHSAKRAAMADLQGVNRSLYSEINPLHLPEVLSLVGRHHGQGELYIALKSSIAGVISTVSRKACILQERDYYLAKVEQLNTELAGIEAAEGDASHISELRFNKRLRA